MYQPILRDWIWTCGRGPELRQVRYSVSGASILALDYVNPDSSSAEDVRHLSFHRAQVAMFTPEEVHNYMFDEVKWGPKINQAAVVNLGKSVWFLTFAQQHLAKCNHYRISFYDEFLDVICEEISAASGSCFADDKA